MFIRFFYAVRCFPNLFSDCPYSFLGFLYFCRRFSIVFSQVIHIYIYVHIWYSFIYLFTRFSSVVLFLFLVLLLCLNPSGTVLFISAQKPGQTSAQGVGAPHPLSLYFLCVLWCSYILWRKMKIHAHWIRENWMKNEVLFLDFPNLFIYVPGCFSFSSFFLDSRSKKWEHPGPG